MERETLRESKSLGESDVVGHGVHGKGRLGIRDRNEPVMGRV